MGEIYQQSQMTIIWLGKEEPHPRAQWVMETFAPIFLEVGKRRGEKYLVARDPFLTTDTDLIADLGGEDIFGVWRRDFSHFFTFLARRRWFLRGWVVQEVLLITLENGADVAVLCGSALPLLWQKLLGFVRLMVSADWTRDILRRLLTDQSPFYPRAPEVILTLDNIDTISRRVRKAY
ncbi:hypothetical protein QBC35DRAFT_232398 [Podospora australis]|uniref:Heterokaryon incompatibility domain-containing protein n=1 Tax=Podospora australis TaxID=1536484 RepID=A0AAN7AGB4_9PEZI|nr:hypothetical protein QBC35DRAFT_232398 [Podospora australis]